MIIVSPYLPESRLVLFDKFDLVQELGTFPSIQMRIDDAYGPTVFARDQFTVQGVGEETFVVHQIRERHIRVISIRRFLNNELSRSFWLNKFCDL